MMTPLQVAAARQTVRFRVPKATTGRMSARVPGNVEMKSGATVLRRSVEDGDDPDNAITQFDLLPTGADTTLTMSLNNRTARAQQVVTASNVYVAELTEAYERLHVTNSMKILHGAVEQFRIAVPEDFEIIEVKTPMLSRWEVTGAGDDRVLTIHLREPANEMAIVNIAAERTTPSLGEWTLPKLQPLDVASSASIVGVLTAARLETQSLDSTGLLTIDTRVLTETLPETIFAAEAGAPEIKPCLLYTSPSPRDATLSRMPSSA